MTRPLPPHASLEHLRKQAKDVLAAHRRRVPAGCQVLRRLHRLAGASDEELLAAKVTLKQVQFALAMEYGFASWPDLKRAVEGNAAPARPRTLHSRCRARTLPQDNLLNFGSHLDFTTIDVWKAFGDPPRWRVETSGRVIVFDGTDQTTLVKTSRTAWRSQRTDLGGPVGVLLSGDCLLDSWPWRPRPAEAIVSREQRPGPDGREEIVVTVEQPELQRPAGLPGQSVMTIPVREVHRFDARTRRLVYHAYYHRDSLSLEIPAIEYDAPLPARLFELDVPDDVVWHIEPAMLRDQPRYTSMRPEEAARAYLQALADRDWGEVAMFQSATGVSEPTKECFGGLEVLHVGEAFREEEYPGTYVPYEVRLPNGHVKKWNLAIRHDNPANRWIIDGGI